MSRIRNIMQALANAARLVFRLILTIAVIGGAAGAVYYGQALLAERAEAQPAPEAAPLTTVSVRALNLEEGYAQTRAFVGQIEPRKTVSASFELAGQLIEILVDEGDEVAQGQLIAMQDTELLEADRAELQSSREAIEAQLDFALQRLERAEALLDRGFASQERLDEAVSQRDQFQARIREIDARLANTDIRLEKAKLYAPFEGRVTRRFMDGGEALNPGQAVLEIVETAAPLVRVGVPVSLDPENLRGAKIIIGDTEFEADFVALRPDIDSTTRTRTALYQPKTALPAAFGQTAEIRIDTEISSPGTWVPVESLKEGARGQWTLLVLNDEDVVRRATAVVIHAESERVYVQGSFPPGTRMIEVGPQRVVPGQRVRALNQAGLSAEARMIAAEAVARG
jgi:RND family efflux transporter MFP subunit